MLTKTAFMCVPVPKQSESLCAGPRNRGKWLFER